MGVGAKPQIIFLLGGGAFQRFGEKQGVAKSKKGHCDTAGDHAPACRAHGKDRKTVDDAVGGDADKQALALVKEINEEQSEGAGTKHLTEVFDQRGTASVDQIDHMTDTEGERGDDHRALDPLLSHCPKEKATEDQLLQKAHEKHGQQVKDALKRRIVEGDAKPQIAGKGGQQRQIKEKASCRVGGLAKPVFGKQPLFFQKEQQNERKSGKKGQGQRLFNADRGREGIGDACSRHVDADERQREEERTFLVKAFHTVILSAVL